MPLVAHSHLILFFFFFLSAHHIRFCESWGYPVLSEKANLPVHPAKNKILQQQQRMWFSHICSVKAHEADAPAGVLLCGCVYCRRCTMFSIHQSIREFEQFYALELLTINFYVALPLCFMCMQCGCGWWLSFLRHCHYLWWHSMVVTFWRTRRSGWPGAVRMETNAETLM